MALDLTSVYSLLLCDSSLPVNLPNVAGVFLKKTVIAVMVALGFILDKKIRHFVLIFYHEKFEIDNLEVTISNTPVEQTATYQPAIVVRLHDPC